MKEKAKQSAEDRKQIKKSAEDLYLHQGKDFPFISRLYNVPLRTIQRWATEGNWIQLKNQINESSWKTIQKVRAVLPRLIDKLEKSETLATDVDALLKAVSAMKKLEKNVDIVGNALMVFKEFALFIQPINPSASEIIQDHLEAFIGHLQRKYHE